MVTPSLTRHRLIPPVPFVLRSPGPRSEEMHQQRNVFSAFSPWRQSDRRHVETIIEIAPVISWATVECSGEGMTQLRLIMNTVLSSIRSAWPICIRLSSFRVAWSNTAVQMSLADCCKSLVTYIVRFVGLGLMCQPTREDNRVLSTVGAHQPAVARP